MWVLREAKLRCCSYRKQRFGAGAAVFADIEATNVAASW
ncbi:hypothetical protein QE369_003625 [Agrobacterium larrymoorei]|uniref:Uncharacterized protein n=1 Tax=Agrobacterium larrymoorei TaxID=160699 RepID=A0AAJ2BGM4_9HYPH|nr:hypothetical protein [Agrobacterium larrymoorei]